MNTRQRLSYAGRLGGLARNLKYGNPGTEEGRRRGGINSLKTHQAKKTGFIILRAVKFPTHSKELAELLGIFMGDGHVGEYQVSVSINSRTDLDHALFARHLIAKLFRIPVRLRFRSGEKVCELVISSKEICRFLRKEGISSNKVRDGVVIPAWVRRNKPYAAAFI